MIKILAFLVLILAVYAKVTPDQNVPISKVYDGLTLGNPDAPFHIEAFYDLMCIDSKNSNLQLNQAFKKIDFENQDQVKFTYHIFPLPYHYNAFYTAVGFRYILDNFSPKEAKEYINLIFNYQDSLVNSATQDLTQDEIFKGMAKLVSSKMVNVDEEDFYNALQNLDYKIDAMNSSKFSLGVHIAGAPYFWANGIPVIDAPNFKSADWVDFIHQYTDLKE
ncbi:Thioredoxin-like fold [Pseudocohnilembus persalinus]|uniref:Thioredoxin-like fold n=1 Tax=Pseudocohnilembus persalinus TaxID=266149 RepID=A0A0V0QDM3_PSEPJ|nr:Thioredoxin-like fold [Pseudocohnilembus persalinus]|eukprot:KRX00262.1 Thioredoxin-like fold [Pseudocohnilembus persalinus]